MTKPLEKTRERLELQKSLAYDKTFSCVQCGYCLPACPTYESMGKETHSPRGRINLVKMAAEGRLKDLSRLSEAIDMCLGCRACETVCPTGVEYGTIFEAAKSTLQKNKRYPKRVKWMRSLLFKRVFPSRKVMNALAAALWAYQRTGLQSVVRQTGALRLMPNHMGEFEALLPDLPSPAERRRRPSHYRVEGRKPAYRIAFFAGCVMDAVFERINRLSMELLHKGGCEVLVVSGETCCGALHAHAGETELAKQLARKNIEAFERADVDFIVNNSGGCGAMLKEYHHLFHDEPEWRERAVHFVKKSKDISQILASLELPFRIEINERVTYQRSCHMTNVQKVKAEPLRLLQSIPGIMLKEMDKADHCCGSAGIYNIVNYDESMEILDEKMHNVKNTAASIIVTTNPGCLLQMKLGIAHEGMQKQMRAVHLVELLAEACGID